MWAICKKEIRQLFSNLTGYIAIAVFLFLTGLLLFVFPESNIFDFGYATLDKFFEIAPWILLFLIPAITMRSFADEFKSGTYEVLKTKPLTSVAFVTGKYLGAFTVVFAALLPTLLYSISIVNMSGVTGGLDLGATMGSYIGLFFLSAVFTAIGIFCSSLTSNAVVAFLVSALACFMFHNGFAAISKIPLFTSGADYYIEMLGIDFHYRSISKGFIDTRDLVYFISSIAAFLFLTIRNLNKK